MQRMTSPVAWRRYDRARMEGSAVAPASKRSVAVYLRSLTPRFAARCETGDFVLLLYIMVIARQYFWWGVDSNNVAWFLATIAGLPVWWLFVATKQETRVSASLSFVLLVVAPLSFAYGMRMPLPDLSFDVLHYHILHGERSLAGTVYQSNDFFPTYAPFNPAPDTVTAIARHVLGYRLGTIVNLLALVWTGRILDRWLTRRIPNRWFRSLSVLAILCTEQLLFEIDTYMIDLLSLPLLLEAARLAVRDQPDDTHAIPLIRIAFLLGVAIAFKIINIIALPIAGLAALRFIRESGGTHQPGRVARICLVALAALLLPLLPFAVYNYWLTSSPVYPVANAIFKSPLWPANNVWDPRWGPSGAWETLIWPIVMFFQPQRLGELSLYSGRICLGIAAALVGLVVTCRDKELRRLCFIVVIMSALWSTITGYIRYGLVVEMLAGVVVVILVASMMRQRRTYALAYLLIALLGAQSLLACHYILLTEWSQRPTCFQQFQLWKHEAHYLFRDRSLLRFLPKTDQERLREVDVWINSSIKTSGLEVLLNKTAPVIGVCSFELFSARPGRIGFAKAIESAAGKRIFTVALSDQLPDALACLTRRGLHAGKQMSLSVPFYSPDYRIAVVLIEVLGAEEAAAAARAAN